MNQNNNKHPKNNKKKEIKKVSENTIGSGEFE